MKMQEAYKGTELRRSRAEELLDWAENNVPKSYIWENAVSKNDAVPIVKFSELASLKSFIWTEFKKGCDLRKLPNAIDGFMVLECKMKRGTIIEKHAQDFYEAFLIMSGKVRDNVTGEILTANGKPRAWKRGEPHEPECIEDAYLIVFCKL